MNRSSAIGDTPHTVLFMTSLRDLIFSLLVHPPLKWRANLYLAYGAGQSANRARSLCGWALRPRATYAVSRDSTLLLLVHPRLKRRAKL
jgi:hypothetical protein